MLIKEGSHLESGDGRYQIDPDEGTCAFCLAQSVPVLHVRDTNHELSHGLYTIRVEHTFSICHSCCQDMADLYPNEAW